MLALAYDCHDTSNGRLYNSLPGCMLKLTRCPLSVAAPAALATLTSGLGQAGRARHHLSERNPNADA